MNHESITEIESLENQLPRWEKWLYLCYGAAFTMFVNAIVRSVERSYLKGVFTVSAEELKLMGGSINIPDSVVQHIAASLNAPWWFLVCTGILLAVLFPGIVLSFQSGWRKVSIHKGISSLDSSFLHGSCSYHWAYRIRSMGLMATISCCWVQLLQLELVFGGCAESRQRQKCSSPNLLSPRRRGFFVIQSHFRCITS